MSIQCPRLYFPPYLTVLLLGTISADELGVAPGLLCFVFASPSLCRPTCVPDGTKARLSSRCSRQADTHSSRPLRPMSPSFHYDIAQSPSITRRSLPTTNGPGFLAGYRVPRCDTTMLACHIRLGVTFAKASRLKSNHQLTVPEEKQPR